MINKLYLNNRFFYLFGIVAICFAASFVLQGLFPVAQALFVLALALVVLDISLLFRKGVRVKIRRRLPKVFSLGDPNPIKIELSNKSGMQLAITVIDELPVQFQKRDFEESMELTPDEEKVLEYELRPLKRGLYKFGLINVYMSSRLGLVQKRYQHDYAMEIPVYPSIIQMKQYELKAFSKISHQKGIKKIRRIGHSYEFEQIKSYVRGDDFRSINWKASSRRASLMVNQYEDERAQQIYCIIDKSRSMRLPFEGLSLMDYAINTSLVLSNIALQKHDKAGLISFSDKIGTTLKADSRPTQLNKIIQSLYKEKERPKEANYELLYHASRKLITGRSLIILFTNFESSFALDRVLPILRRINTFHLLVVVFFENTEIKEFTEKKVETLEEIYHQTIAQKFLNEKGQMVHKLQQYGIQAILTNPEDLSINTINKYLELKSRGLI